MKLLVAAHRDSGVVADKQTLELLAAYCADTDELPLRVLALRCDARYVLVLKLADATCGGVSIVEVDPVPVIGAGVECHDHVCIVGGDSWENFVSGCTNLVCRRPGDAISGRNHEHIAVRLGRTSASIVGAVPIVGPGDIQKAGAGNKFACGYVFLSISSCAHSIGSATPPLVEGAL